MDDYTLKSAEKQAILRALRKTRGNRSSAADLLGCGKTTLYRKIGSFNITEKDWECIPISALPKPTEIEDSKKEESISFNGDSTISKDFPITRQG